MEGATTLVAPPVAATIAHQDSDAGGGATVVSTTTADAGGAIGVMQPVPMSFPAFLRDSGISDRFAHLRAGHSSITTSGPGVASAPLQPKKSKRDEKDGKRWARRKENGSFSISPMFHRSSL